MGKKKLHKKTLLLLTRRKFGGKICMSEYKLPGDLPPNASRANQNGFFRAYKSFKACLPSGSGEICTRCIRLIKSPVELFSSFSRW